MYDRPLLPSAEVHLWRSFGGLLSAPLALSRSLEGLVAQGLDGPKRGCSSSANPCLTDRPSGNSTVIKSQARHGCAAADAMGRYFVRVNTDRFLA